MEKTTLLIFIQEIINRSDNRQAELALEQLATILEQQGDTQSAELVRQALRGRPEIREYTKLGRLTQAQIEIAEQRAKDRVAREEEMRRRYGRC